MNSAEKKCHLKDLATFLLDHHQASLSAYLSDQIYDAIPKMASFEVYDQAELKLLFSGTWEQLLTDMAAGKELPDLRLTGSEIVHLDHRQALADLTQIVSAYKLAIYHHIPLYTDCMQSYRSLVMEVEQLFTRSLARIQNKLTMPMPSAAPSSKTALINRELQAMANIGYFEYYVGTASIHWSDQLYRIYGYEPGELPMEPAVIEQLTIPEEEIPYRNELMMRILQAPVSTEYKHRIRRKDGSIGIIAGKVSSMFNNGALDSVVGYAQDITQHELREMVQRKKDHFYEMLIHTIPDQVFVLDIQSGAVLYANQHMLELTGLSESLPPSGAPGYLRQIIHPQDMPEVSSYLQHIGDAGASKTMQKEFRIIDKSGAYRWVRSFCAVFRRDDNGKALEILGTLLEITDLKRTEEDLKQLNTGLEELAQTRTTELENSRKLLQLIIDRLPALISYVNKDERYVFVNDTYRRWHHKDTSYFVGKKVKDALGETIYPSIRSHLQRCFSGQEVVFEASLQFSSGQKHLQVSYLLDKDEHGAVAGAVVLALDMTRTKLLDAELRQREKELRLITDAIPASISYFDQQEICKFANRTFISWYGNGKEVPGRHLNDIIPDIYPDIHQYVQTVLRGQFVSYEHSFLKEDRMTTLKVQYIPDTATDGSIIGFICMVLDVTDDKQKELDLQKKNHELTRINNDLDSFIYTASHDLKAPVSNIEGLIYTLADSLHEKFTLEADMEEIIEMIKRSVQRFQNTLKDLTDISKVQRDWQDDIEMVDLAEMLEEVKWSLDKLIDDSQAVLKIDISSTRYLTFSRINIRSIFFNLISNAIKYRSPDKIPSVRVTCKKVDDFTLIEVSDNGMGIDKSQQDKVFKMFKRLHTHVEGSGIGLYIVKRIVDNVGGRLELESQEGEGSTFRIWLPELAEIH